VGVEKVAVLAHVDQRQHIRIGKLPWAPFAGIRPPTEVVLERPCPSLHLLAIHAENAGCICNASIHSWLGRRYPVSVNLGRRASARSWTNTDHHQTNAVAGQQILDLVPCDDKLPEEVAAIVGKHRLDHAALIHP